MWCVLLWVVVCVERVGGCGWVWVWRYWGVGGGAGWMERPSYLALSPLNPLHLDLTSAACAAAAASARLAAHH